MIDRSYGKNIIPSDQGATVADLNKRCEGRDLFATIPIGVHDEIREVTPGRDFNVIDLKDDSCARERLQCPQKKTDLDTFHYSNATRAHPWRPQIQIAQCINTSVLSWPLHYSSPCVKSMNRVSFDATNPMLK
ncbi:MAG: hypothetical protein AAFX06_32695 [Planctomycetota bacterium]